MSLRRGKGTGNVSSPAGPCRFDSIVFERKQRRRRKSLKPISMLFFLAASFIIRVSSKAKTRFSAFKPYKKKTDGKAKPNLAITQWCRLLGATLHSLQGLHSSNQKVGKSLWPFFYPKVGSEQNQTNPRQTYTCTANIKTIC